ncbi:Methyltransferase FkbM domain-containing protein [Caenorhabditis elegans]|uniref:Methyltransferase FkbM domain-containing protein n=1 Tax=Caenorhabditis elegans TaxID=6239 RepID=Q95XC1_CAEEL|nr:Methyltransferase FkbM domain-containing protein [Caenorhabditis elegans]CCD73897.2 Methyltransferase FkbM domain-containing protein [Caenorhabditis elegans]
MAVFLFVMISTLNRSQQEMDSKRSDPVELPKTEKKELTTDWDTLDGVGYRFAKDKEIVMDPRFEELEKLPTCDLTVDKTSQKIDIPKLMDSFQDCIRPIVNEWKNDLKAKEENIMVTLGIGHDTMAEEKLNRTLPNTKFFGADPIIEPNRQLYTAFGKYFPFAIGKKPGFTKFRVLPNQNQRTRKYQYQDVTTIPLTYFLSDILGLEQIDIAWIDIEGGEFEFLDQLHKGGPLDEKGVSICQFNLEVHSKFHPPGAQIYHDFVFKVLEDRRYVFLKPAHSDSGVHRMFFFNLENEKCVRKFLQ